MEFLTFGAIILGIVIILALGALAAIGTILITALEGLGYLLIAAIAFLLIYAACFWIKVGYKKIKTYIYRKIRCTNDTCKG